MDNEQLVRKLLDILDAEQEADYLARGRRFAAIAVDDLPALWLAALEIWAAQESEAIERELDDLAAELRLRGIPVPRDTPVARAIFDTVEARHSPEELDRRQREAIRSLRPLLDRYDNLN